MGYDWNDMMGWGSNNFLGEFMMLIFWVVIIVCIIWFVKYIGDRDNYTARKNRREKSALDILKERYAKGEIDKKEFDEKKRDIEG